MNRALVARRAAILVIIIEVAAAAYWWGIASAAPAPKWPFDIHGSIYYISNNAILKLDPGEAWRAQPVFAPGTIAKGVTQEINGLSKGPGDTLLFHMTTSSGIVGTQLGTEAKSSCMILDLKTAQASSLVELPGTSVTFPSLSPDGSKVAMAGRMPGLARAFLVTKSLLDGSIREFHSFPLLHLKVSWRNDNKHVLLAGAREEDRNSMYSFNIEDETLERIGLGIMPLASPDNGLLAYVTPDHRELVVTESTGKVTNRFRGELVRDLCQWVSRDAILITVGRGFYRDAMAIADIKKSRLDVVDLPTKGEISGLVIVQRGP